MNDCCYLHVNGDLIFKPSDNACDIRDSDLCRGLWFLDPSNRESAWTLLVESLAAGANRDRVFGLAQKWECDDADADTYAHRVGCIIKMDGNKWCAHRSDFENLQDSEAGFGDTALEAMANLAKQLGYMPNKMWGASFKDLLRTEQPNRE